jgi:lipoprotein-anchoring transpeptidase ErfK/SrfK
MSKRWSLLIAATAAVLALPAHANIVITVDKSAQDMAVAVDGVTRYHWPVSTARAGYNTPNGVYHPERLERSWFSRLYYNSPMPYSIFFHGGYAIHGSYEINRLGGPASHGCVRLNPENAATLFKLVQEEGARATTIVVTGGGAGVARRNPGVPAGSPYSQSPSYPAANPFAPTPYAPFPAVYR